MLLLLLQKKKLISSVRSGVGAFAAPDNLHLAPGKKILFPYNISLRILERSTPMLSEEQGGFRGSWLFLLRYMLCFDDWN